MAQELKHLWARTDAHICFLEHEIIATYMSFLRKVAKHYLQQGSLVYFRENTVVHYGEGGFGQLTIEGNEDNCAIFGDYVCEVNFQPDVSTLAEWGYTQITETNLESIRYAR